jgi:signal transduction histidine kinase
MSTLADELATTFLFERLTPEQRAWLAERGEVVTYDAGAHVYAEGEPATAFFLLLDGGVRLTRRVGSQTIAMNETTQRGVYAGATRAYVTAAESEAYSNGLETTRPSRLFRLPAADFAAFMHDHFPMAIHLLDGLFLGVRSAEATVRQHEQLIALGTLSAGLAHELNNPAAAGVRATSQLRQRVAGMRHKLGLLAQGHLDAEALATLVRIQEDAIERAAKAPVRSALDESDAEEAIGERLEDLGIAGPWELAGALASSGLDGGWVDEVVEDVGTALAEPALRWLAYTLETEALMVEIEESTGRISELVAAVKQYSYMDRAPFAEVDVAEGLGSTITLLGHRLRGIEVTADLPSDLPRVPGHGGELNQVWTNLLDNAADAAGDGGHVQVRAHADGDGVLVEVVDDGPGIPPEVLPRIFEAFFTTKAAGEGTGLGLEIAHRIVTQRHAGRLEVDSRPGETRFTVWLPTSEGAR